MIVSCGAGILPVLHGTGWKQVPHVNGTGYA